MNPFLFRAFAVSLLFLAAPRVARATEPVRAAPVIELYTMGQGDLLFEKFGHAALCVVDVEPRRRTRCYNYGTTDFDSVVPLFWGFLRGRSLFWVSVSTLPQMLTYYRDADRTIWRQELPIADQAARQLAAELARAAASSARYYRYHHYRDNCSTRLRDLVDRATGGALSRSRAGESDQPSYRELSRRGFAGDTALLLGSDLLLGRDVDRRPSTYQAMFLPDVLRAEVAARLGAHPEIIYQRVGPDFPSDPGLGGRWFWLALAAACAAPIAIARWRGRGERLALGLAVAIPALIGLALWFLALASSLPEVRWNEALLVFLPTDAAVPFLHAPSARRYAAVRVGLLALVSLLRAVGVLVQPLWLLVAVPLAPMILMLARRREREKN